MLLLHCHQDERKWLRSNRLPPNSYTAWHCYAERCMKYFAIDCIPQLGSCPTQLWSNYWCRSNTATRFHGPLVQIEQHASFRIYQSSPTAATLTLAGEGGPRSAIYVSACGKKDFCCPVSIERKTATTQRRHTSCFPFSRDRTNCGESSRFRRTSLTICLSRTPSRKENLSPWQPHTLDGFYPFLAVHTTVCASKACAFLP